MVNRKVATQLPLPNSISSRHIEDETSTETNTKTSNIENQIRSATLERSIINEYWNRKPVYREPNQYF